MCNHFLSYLVREAKSNFWRRWRYKRQHRLDQPAKQTQTTLQHTFICIKRYDEEILEEFGHCKSTAPAVRAAAIHEFQHGLTMVQSNLATSGSTTKKYPGIGVGTPSHLPLSAVYEAHG